MSAQDSVVVESPLPGGVAEFVRAVFSVPQWIQIWGAILGVLVGGGLAFVLWRQRAAILRWVLTRSLALKWSLGIGAIALISVAAIGGAVSWDYMQHNNDFCTGCHVMGGAYERFKASEHDTLSCHDCHQQSIFASTRQLYLWVLERPEDIGEHAKVPNVICETCHVTGEPEVWQHVASTAGHRTHLESDSTALSDIMCVTCHGLEVHRFVPVDSTCGQANCHITNDIVMGTMAQQTALHCATCHQFTRDVPLLATTDSARGTLRPALDQCFSCHEMQTMMTDFDPVAEPHSGGCGVCHNPHEQEQVSDAATTCALAGCHDTWRARPFHVGTRHVNVGENCVLCHAPHSAVVDASDCEGCHAEIAERPDTPRRLRERLQRLAPFDTASAISRPIGAAVPGWRHDGAPLGATRDSPGRHIPLFFGAGPPLVSLDPLPPDTFSHREHESLTCLTCHRTSEGHGGLTFAVPRGCDICHHQAPATSDCVACHAGTELATGLPARLTLLVADTARRERDVSFAHAEHESVACVKCHTEPVSLGALSPVTTCTDCHDDHHTAERACLSCHASTTMTTAHTPPVDAHVACDACHRVGTIERLVPDQAFCVTCHEPQRVDHYPERECTTCHMLVDPATFRHRLVRRAAGQ